MKFFSQAKRYDDFTTLSDEDLICYCLQVDKGTIVEAIRDGAATLKAIKETTTACTGSDCAEKNPNQRCCSKEIKQLIQLEVADV